MSKNYTERLSQLIAKIMEMPKDERLITKLEKVISIHTIDFALDKDYQQVSEELAPYIVEIEEDFDLDKIKAEQGYTHFNLKEMDKIVDRIDIQEPFEELLEILD